MRRMRLITEAYAEILENDPDTAITMSAFRRLVVGGRIPSIMIGNKRLVSMEAVEHFFQNGDSVEEMPRKAGLVQPVDL